METTDNVDIKVNSDTESVELFDNMDVRITKMHVKTVLDELNRVLQGRSVNRSNILRLTLALISITKKLKNGTAKLPGRVKKQILLTALKNKLDKSDLLPVDRELVYLLAADACDVLVEAVGASQQTCCVTM